jgi:hypothetical protein
MLRTMMLVIAMLTVACSARQANNDATDAVAGDPEWSPCVVKGEFETCAEVCEAEGMACLAAGCPADPYSCKPKTCDMATSLLGLGDAICTDESVGSTVAAACDAPIEFIFNDTARCCCEG